MDLGEQISALENHIYLFAKTQCDNNGIPPTLARLIMEGVYSKFQNEAISSMIVSSFKFDDTAAIDKMKETYTGTESQGVKENAEV